MSASTGGVTEVRKLARAGQLAWNMSTDGHVEQNMRRFGFEKPDMAHCIQFGQLRETQDDNPDAPVKSVDKLKYIFDGKNRDGDDFFLVCKICERGDGSRYLFIVTAHPPRE